jgi:hypothetical protein
MIALEPAQFGALMKLAPLWLIMFCHVAFGDELILKDGKKVEWVVLRDLGDTYEVETPQGTKITVKKDDVESLAKKKAPELLTGASITFEKKLKLEKIDLLSRIDPKKDGITGTWRLAGGALFGQGAENMIAKCQLSAFTAIPEEYDLLIEVTRKDGNDALTVGLIGGGHQFDVFFDGYFSTFSGPACYNGTSANTNGLGVPGKFFANGKPRQINFMVRKEALVIQADGKDFVTWKADWTKMTLTPVQAVPAKNTMFLSVERSGYQITKMILTAPK